MDLYAQRTLDGKQLMRSDSMPVIVYEDGSDDECPVLAPEQEPIVQTTSNLQDEVALEGLQESDRSDYHNPVCNFSLLIGNKKLSFKIADATSSSSYCVSRKCSSDLSIEGSMSEQGASDSTQLYTCKVCSHVCTKGHCFTLHEKVHSENKKFHCPICTKSFARQTNYNMHMKLHASGRRHFCSLCGQWYRTENEMLKHQHQCRAFMNGYDVPTERPLRYKCSYCERMFHHRRNKVIHERTHTGERPYSCGYCGRGFTQSQALTIHIRTHTGERPYVCSICSREFRDSSALRKHEFLNHVNERISGDELDGQRDVVTTFI